MKLHLFRFDGGFGVYDTESDVVHCLNARAMRVWRLARARRSVKEIATELDGAAEVERVLAALTEADLLGAEANLPPEATDETTGQAPEMLTFPLDGMSQFLPLWFFQEERFCCSRSR